MPPAAPPSLDEWKDRIAPLLGVSLREVSERITSHPSIQAWLHEASFEIAQDLAGTADMQAQTQAYGRMLDALEAQFPSLAAAIRELTGGCGRLDLHWRPLEPNYSRIYLNFDRAFEVDVFYRLDAPSMDEATHALRTVKAALPKGEPFPNRPNTATGMVNHADRCTGVRFSDRVDEHGARWQRVTLLPSSDEPIENLQEEEAARALLDLLETAT